MVIPSTVFRRDLDSIVELGLRGWKSRTEDLVSSVARAPYVLVPGGRIARRAARAFGDQCVGIGDSDGDKWGETVEGLAVQSIEEVTKNNPDATVVICSAVFGHTIEEMLRAQGINKIVPYPVATLAWPDVFCNQEYQGLGEAIFESDSYSKMLELSECLADEESRSVLWGKAAFFLSRARENLVNIRSPHTRYFHNDIVQPAGQGERFVDVGAFSGDTLHEWKKFGPEKFDYYLAFEPDESAYSRLLNEANSDERIHCVKLGLADKSERVFFDQHGVADSRITRGGDLSLGASLIETVRLDEYLEDFGLPSQVKMDIEGAERLAIKGGKATLSDRSVRLSISAYHFPTDLWEIPLLLREIRPNSRVFLRHYTSEIDDTVCYVLD